MAKAREAKRVKMAQRELVRRKVEEALPITEQERNLLSWRGGNVSKGNLEKATMAAAAKLMIKPQSITELRLLVETTAAKNHYNPLEKLIELTQSNSLTDTEKVTIHKALLPFLVPQLATPKATEEKNNSGIKVVVTQFQFPENPGRAEKALHETKPPTVETTAE